MVRQLPDLPDRLLRPWMCWFICLFRRLNTLHDCRNSHPKWKNSETINPCTPDCQENNQAVLRASWCSSLRTLSHWYRWKSLSRRMSTHDLGLYVVQLSRNRFHASHVQGIYPVLFLKYYTSGERHQWTVVAYSSLHATQFTNIRGAINKFCVSIWCKNYTANIFALFFNIIALNSVRSRSH